MYRKCTVFIVAFGIVVFSIGWAFAQSCPDVVGEWDFKGEQILSQWRYGEDPPFVFTFQSVNGVIEIENQQGCLFNGWLYLDAFQFPLVGTINNRNIKMVSGDAVINARLRGYDRDTGLFTIMYIAACDTIDDLLELPPEDTFMSCGQGTALRKQP
jgi:hypothetical protein